MLEAHSQLSVMLPALKCFKAALRDLLTAEAALARHLRLSPEAEHENVTMYHAKIIAAQLRMQREVSSLIADTAVLATRTKSCPPNALFIP